MNNGGDSSDDSSVEIIEPPIQNYNSTVPNPLSSVPAPQSMGVTKEKDDSSVEIIEPPSSTASSTPQLPGGKPSQYMTCWTCDVCKLAHFKTFEEAEEHEIQCKIDLENKKKETHPKQKPNRGVEYLSSDSRQPAKNAVLFSPFVQGAFGHHVSTE